MAIFGAYSGAIKKTYDDITTAAISNGADTPVDISAGISAPAQAGATYIVCLITTTANTRIQVGDVSTATSFLITSSDEFICTIATDRPIGLWGVTGTPTVTIRRLITG